MSASEDNFDEARDRYDAFIEERKTLFQTAKEASDQYSKAILTLSGGSLGLSITFIDKVAPHPSESSLWFLASAWLVFAISMLVTTTSFLLGQFAYLRQIDVSQAALLEPAAEPVTNRYVPWMKGLDLSGLVLFAVGIALILVFATVNLKARARSSSPSSPSTTSAEARP